jgi:hypothetical protein
MSRKRLQSPWSDRRPLILVFGGLALLGLIAFAIWQSTASSTPKVPLEVQGSPKLKIDKQKVDLGDVPLGQTVEVTFNLANIGDQQLRFTDPPYIELVEGC